LICRQFTLPANSLDNSPSLRNTGFVIADVTLPVTKKLKLSELSFDRGRNSAADADVAPYWLRSIILLLVP